MNCSPARLAANRANASRSTGPRTEEGKAASRGNALKHGLTGSGVVIPAEDAGRVADRMRSFEAELGPTGEVGRALVGRAALLSVRLERCVLHESAATSERMRRAVDDFDEARLDQVDRLVDGLDDDPAAAVRKLRRMPEGVDRMVALWSALKQDLGRGPGGPRWTAAHRRLADGLTGLRADDLGTSPFEGPSIPLGDGSRDDAGRRRAAVAIGEMIDAEVAGLLDHRATLDLDAIAANRASAPARALFDPSPESTLARKYEAAAERGFFRALRELKAVEEAATKQARPSPPTATHRGSLASFFPAERPEAAPPIPPAPRLEPARPAAPIMAPIPTNLVALTIGRPGGGRS